MRGIDVVEHDGRTDQISLQISGRKITFVRLDKTSGGQYVIFPITGDGLHYSIHPSGNPHLENKFGRLAELDIEALKQVTIEDFKTLFRYPSYHRDVYVLPISSSLGAWFGDTFEFPEMFSKVFHDRLLYVMRARRLPEFFQTKPADYMVIDPKRDDRAIMQFKGNPLGPLNLDLNKGPRNPRMKNLFSINLGIQKALRKIPDSQIKGVEPDEFTISQWGAIIEAVLEQVQVIRWNKGGQERLLGTMVHYLRTRRLSLA